MTGFSIKNQWVKLDGDITDESKATLARLQIIVGKTNITDHKVQREISDHLIIPAYYLAEWIAENWWVLLYEPQKNEDGNDTGYYFRHSIVAAQHGFPLPDLSLVPFGRSFRLNSNKRRPSFANVSFFREVFCDFPREDVETVLKSFVVSAIDRLSSFGVTGTPLESAWRAVDTLTDDEKAFCEIVGSMGISPADLDEGLADGIERIYDILGETASKDFFLAAIKSDVSSSIATINAVKEYLHRSGAIEAQKLFDVQVPPENFYAPSWRRGMSAAKSVREKFNVSTSDPKGADKIFETLKINTENYFHGANNGYTVPFVGAIDRTDGEARMLLIQKGENHRRFSAGRAAYLAWVSDKHSSRLVTNAVTRDQQASRSFAAEILIPQAYLKAAAGPKGKLHYEQVKEIGRQRGVMPDVVRKQASNAGISLSDI